MGGTFQDLYFVIAHIARAAIYHKPIYLADYKISGGKLEWVIGTGALCIHQIGGTPATWRRESRAIIINCCLQALLAAWITVGRGDFQGNGGGASKKAKPLVVVQLPARAAREIPRLIAVIDFCTVTIQAFTNNRVAAVATRVGEAGWWTLGKNRG